MSAFMFLLLQFAILAYALVAGVFLAFSDFLMRSLAQTGGVGGVEAMQIINREVFRWVFMTLFLGMTAVSLGVAGYGATNLGHPAGALCNGLGLRCSRRLRPPGGTNARIQPRGRVCGGRTR